MPITVSLGQGVWWGLARWSWTLGTFPALLRASCYYNGSVPALALRLITKL